MQPIEAILFDPVGCLAEFASEEFDAIAERVFGRPPASGRSGSEAYWDVLSLMHTGGKPLTARERAMVEDYEMQAVDGARAYEDAAPALMELGDLGITSIVASSLSAAAVTRFLERFSLANFFSTRRAGFEARGRQADLTSLRQGYVGPPKLQRRRKVRTTSPGCEAASMHIWNRDAAGGVKDAPLMKAITSRSLRPDRVMFITDTADGLQTAKHVGVNAILMMNDPDEAMKLTAHEPAGGIVSLHELPDFVRLVAAENARSEPGTARRSPARASRSASPRV